MSKKFYLVPVLVFILFVFSTGCVYASNLQEPVDDMSGYDSWSESEKNQYKEYLLRMALPGITGYGFDTISDDILANDYPAIYTQGYDSYIDFLLAHSSLDVENDSIVFDDDAMGYINYVKEEVDEQITYINVYLPTSSQIIASSFDDRHSYLGYTELIKNNPSFMFHLTGTRYYSTETLTLEDGSTNDINAWRYLYIVDVPYAFVSSDFDMNIFCATHYDDGWNTERNAICARLVDFSNNSFLYLLVDSTNNIWRKYDLTRDVSKLSELNLSELPCNGSTYDSLCGVSAYVSPQRSSFNGGSGVYLDSWQSDFTGAFRCYDSEASMKEWSDGLGQIMPGYSSGAITDNSITTSEVNEYITTYNNYYGSSGGSGDGSGDDSGSSSGGWLDTLLNGIGNIGDAIMSIISKFIEILSEIFTFFTETLLEAIDIIPTNFIDFLSAFFPFIPEEWITAVSLLLVLLLIGVFIKFLK
ncbi:MAG: hypothetical protein J6J11_00265 [Treponema sp.]|nr:hypothetical protein [Clostridia bacterium]MBP3606745.1 hypothetical protein [Treponema sp.]